MIAQELGPSSTKELGLRVSHGGCDRRKRDAAQWCKTCSGALIVGKARVSAMISASHRCCSQRYRLVSALAVRSRCRGLVIAAAGRVSQIRRRSAAGTRPGLDSRSAWLGNQSGVTSIGTLARRRSSPNGTRRIRGKSQWNSWCCYLARPGTNW